MRRGAAPYGILRRFRRIPQDAEPQRSASGVDEPLASGRTVVGSDADEGGSDQAPIGRAARVLPGVAPPARGDRQPHRRRPRLIVGPSRHQHAAALVRPHHRVAAVPADVTWLHPTSGDIAQQLDGIAEPNGLRTGHLYR